MCERVSQCCRTVSSPELPAQWLATLLCLSSVLGSNSLKQRGQLAVHYPGRPRPNSVKIRQIVRVGRHSMASPLPPSPKVRFGSFELDASVGQLFKSGIPIKLQPQPLRVLVLLTERAGQVVTREEIQRCLWGDSTFVDFERGINFSINQIRGALSDNPEKPRYIATLPRVGYRFIAELNGESVSAPVIAPSTTTHSRSTLADMKLARATSTEALSRHHAPRSWSYRWYVLSGAIVALLILAAVGYSVHTRFSARRIPDFQALSIVKLTDTGTVEDVAISPDGRYVVYALRDGEKEGLWLRKITSTNDIQILAPDINGFHGLTFSRDGDYIYFVRSDKNDPFFKYLYSIPVLGGSPRKLATDVDSPVGFSPDGHQFVYEHCIPKYNVIELKITDTTELGEHLLSTLSGVSCSLFQPGPNWSPLGQTIVVPVYMLGRQQWVLDAVSVSNGRVRELYSSADDIGRPVWLAAGNELLVPHHDQASGREQLWTISYPEGKIRRLTNDLFEYGTDLDITRDGGTAAGIARLTISNVWVAPAAEPLKARQITSGSLPMTDVAFNADGRVLAMSSDNRLWIMNANGSERTLLANEAGWLTPCGQSVVYASYKEGSVTLTRTNAEGANPHKIVSGSLWKPLKTSFSARGPACSPDGQYIFYLNSEHPQKICRVPVEGGTPVEIAETLGDTIAGRLSVSPDGKLISYIYDKYSAAIKPGWKLVVIPAGGGPPIKTFEVPGGASGPRWSPDGKRLQYLLTRDGISNVWEQPLADGAPRQFTRFTSGEAFEFAWSADHNSLLLTRGSVSSDVVLLSNLR